MALAFLSHQPESMPFGENELSTACIRLKVMLLDEIMRRAARGCQIFYCGAERDNDIIFGEQVLWVKATTYPTLQLICVVSYEGQESGWSEEWRNHYFRLLAQADDTVLISKRYTRDC